MATETDTTSNEVSGDIVRLIHYDDSGVDPALTVLALTTKDALSFTTEEEENTVNLAQERRTRRYRTHNQATLEATMLLATDLDALDTIGVVDIANDGELSFDNADRRWPADHYLHVEYLDDEGGATELQHRFADIEVANVEIAIGDNPPVTSLTFWVHGSAFLAWTAA